MKDFYNSTRPYDLPTKSDKVIISALTGLCLSLLIVIALLVTKDKDEIKQVTKSIPIHRIRPINWDALLKDKQKMERIMDKEQMSNSSNYPKAIK